jgi:inhibitor of cysteine peptidase
MRRQEKLFVSLVIITVLVLSSAAVFAPSPQRQVGQSGNVSSFASYQEMKTYLQQATSYYPKNAVDFGLALPGVQGASALALSYTTTNIQVEGVDEPDIVKSDGIHLYVASGGNVSIILAYPVNESKVLTRLSYQGQVIGLFLSGNRLVVIEQGPLNGKSNVYSQAVTLVLYDITDPALPSLVRSASIQGSYINSRLVGGYVYAIVQQPTVRPDSNGTSTVLPPVVLVGKTNFTIPASQVYYTPTSTVPFGIYTIIVSLNIADGSHSEEAVLTGWSSTIYASQSNIYLAFGDRVFLPMMGVASLPVAGGQAPAVGALLRPIWWGGYSNTTIFRVSISSGTTAVAAEGTVPGTVLNQFSLDEYNGNLRVATTSYDKLQNGSSVQVNNVFVLDQSMKVSGSLEGLAPNEKIYSVRFLGDVGYVVTFERIDPLFAISFANPTQPKVMSSLQLTGFSDYLHPLGNGYLIGVGKNTVPAPAESGYVLYLGMKLSLFHVYTNGSSAEVSKYLIGDRGSDSPALYDHHAFVYDPNTGVMALPILVAKVSNNTSGGAFPAYGTPVWQGAYLFKVSTTAGFQLIGRVTQIPDGKPIDQSSGLFINRIVIVGGYVFTVSNSMVFVNSLSDLGGVKKISLT